MISRDWSLRGALFAVAATLSLAQAPVAPEAPAPAPVAPPPLKDADGRTLRRAVTGHITNYYEDKVPAYTLPDPLKMANGDAVGDADAWNNVRRPELLKLYETEIFGRVPATAPSVRFEVVDEVRVLNGTALRKHITMHFGDKPDGPVVNVTLYRSVQAAGPLPLVLHLTFGGDPAVQPLPGDRPGQTPAGQQAGTVPSATPRRFNDMAPISELMAQGLAYGVVRYTEIQADTKDSYTGGVIGLALAPGQAKPAPDEWGTIAAWSWGLSRLMDYLETDSTVDPRRVALVGHSRLGKTVLWTGATDPRFALIYSSQSGEMGASLSRRDYGESVDDIAAGLAHEFAGNFQKYIGRWNEMPHEAHLLLALNAPRPVFISGGNGDLWSDPHGMFLAMVAAGPVWRLLGQEDLGTTKRPPLDQAVGQGGLAFMEHDGGHVISPLDWKMFAAFAGWHLNRITPRVPFMGPQPGG